jgi:hypothetical protein
VGRYIYFRYEISGKDTSGSSGRGGTDDGANTNGDRQEEIEGKHVEYSDRFLGPVLAGPPRIREHSLRVVCGELDNRYGRYDVVTKAGELVIAVGAYVGGQEGKSQYWWMRVRDGERENITEPRPLTPNHRQCKLEHTLDGGGQFRLHGAMCTELPYCEDDPRLYRTTENDIGCILKVKCIPTRIDGYEGDIVTSKPSQTIQMKDIHDNGNITTTNTSSAESTARGAKSSDSGGGSPRRTQSGQSNLGGPVDVDVDVNADTSQLQAIAML